MSLTLSCACGQLRGRWNGAGPIGRLECYCRDCRAFARWLGRDGLLNDAGGVSVVSVAARSVQFDQGREQLACQSLSEQGLARWWARCCRTPVGNTLRRPHLPFLGMHRALVKASDAVLDRVAGPVCWQLFTASAIGPVPELPQRSLLRMVRGPGQLALERLRGVSPEGEFFDALGRLRLQPSDLTPDERAALARLDPPRRTA